jgi:hypothetical protein
MTAKAFVPKVNDLVRAKAFEGILKVTGVQVRGEKCFIQQFNVSKQALVDEPQLLVECSTLTPFREDASQAAARIVREATENK